MKNWQQYTLSERRTIISNVAQQSGTPNDENAIEKDWWVTMVLKALFATSCKDFLTFKGGTSLSKGWGVIERFSEDIDIAIDRSLWNITSDNKSQRDKLRKQSRTFIKEHLCDELRAGLVNLGLKDFDVNYEEADDSDKDPTIVIAPYKSILPTSEYVQPIVKIEFSCRSLREPFEDVTIQSLIAQYYPDVFTGEEFVVKGVVPTRTFLEKAFLLHEEFQKDIIRTDRMTRHLYDLEKLMRTGFAEAALNDTRMYVDIVKHRSIFTAIRGVDYKTHSPQTIDFIPPTRILSAYERDYAQMRTSFIYGDSLEFDELLSQMELLKRRFRQILIEDPFFNVHY